MFTYACIKSRQTWNVLKHVWYGSVFDFGILLIANYTAYIMISFKNSQFRTSARLEDRFSEAELIIIIVINLFKDNEQMAAVKFFLKSYKPCPLQNTNLCVELKRTHFISQLIFFWLYK